MKNNKIIIMITPQFSLVPQESDIVCNVVVFCFTAEETVHADQVILLIIIPYES